MGRIAAGDRKLPVSVGLESFGEATWMARVEGQVTDLQSHVIDLEEARRLLRSEARKAKSLLVESK